MNKKNKLAIGSFVLITAATFLGVVGVTTTFWIDEDRGGHYGLFDTCGWSGFPKLDSENLAEWWRCVQQALVLIGVLCLCAALLLSPCYLCPTSWDYCSWSEGTIWQRPHSSSPWELLCLFIGVIMFGHWAVKDVEYLGFSYWFTVIAAALSLLLAVMTCVMKVKRISPSCI